MVRLRVLQVSLQVQGCIEAVFSVAVGCILAFVACIVAWVVAVFLEEGACTWAFVAVVACTLEAPACIWVLVEVA